MSYSPVAADKSATFLPNLSSIKSTQKSAYFKQSDSLFHEIYLIIELSLPIGFAIASEWIPVYAGNAVLGHLPNAELLLSGAGLARTFNNVTGASLAWAFTQGLFTLIPQAIGRNRMDLLSIYLQRATYVCFIIALPLSVLQLFGGDFFIAIGEPTEIKDIIYNCCKWGIGNIFALVLVSLLQKFAQAFNYQFELLIISIICAVSAYPLAAFLIKSEYLNLGYIGCPIAVFILNFVNSFFIVVLLLYKGHYQLFIPHSISEIFKWGHVYEYILLCLPALFTNSLEWWIIEITTALAGYVVNPDIALSSNIIIGNIQICTTLLALGNSAGVNIRVGKYVGSNMISKAKQSHNAGLIVAIMYSVIMICTIYFSINKLPLIFTNKYQTEIIDTTISGLYMIIFGITFMNIMQVVGGVYRAIGKQVYSAVFISGSYYLIGLSLTMVLLFAFDFKNNLIYGVSCIWFGWCIANLFGSLLLELYYTCCVDWNKVIKESNKRIDNDNSKINTFESGEHYGSIDVNESK